MRKAGYAKTGEIDYNLNLIFLQDYWFDVVRRSDVKMIVRVFDEQAVHTSQML